MITPDFSMTTLEAAMQNTTNAVTLQVDQFNAQLKAGYLTKFDNWSQSVVAGRIDNSNPPHPPDGYVVGYFIDETNPKARWAYPLTGTSPVCAMPPLPPASKQYTPPVWPEPDFLRNVPPGDTMPVGYIAIAPDGARWQKQVSHTPFGTAYFYAKIA